MTEAEIDALLASRGYRRIASPDRFWRSWLWVEPLRDDAVATKLCQGTYGVNSDGLNWLLDHYCELKGGYYTDSQRANNKRASKREVQQR